MKSIKNTLVTAVVILTMFLPELAAQLPNTMYFLPGVPQSNRINPATTPGCSFYLGFPGLAPLRLQVTSSSLSYNDVFYYDEVQDSLLTVAHPDITDVFRNAFLSKLEEDNYFGTDVSFSLASFGFSSGKSFFSFDITSRVDNKFYYPGGIFSYLLDPEDTGELISLSGIGADVTVFNEISLGWSRKDFLVENLDFGLRGKVLFGLANMSTTESTLEILPTRDVLGINSNTQFKVAAPSLVEFSEGDTIPGVTVAENYFGSANGFGIFLDALGQPGLGVDLGINYRPVPQLRLSASLVDLGFINWNNTLSGTMDFTYDFTGLEVNPFTGIDTTFVQELTDTLLNSISFTANEAYVSRLNSKLFFGVSYYPIRRIGVGLLSRTEFLNDRISLQFTGSLNMTTGKFINLSLSYSYLSETFNHIGAGLSLNAGPFNLYVISDNAVSAVLWPMDARSVNLWFGLNLTFGWKRMRQPKGPSDMPLIL